jgi:hypothetical protein
MALSGAPERTTFVTSDPDLSPRIALCRLLRGVVPWSPVIPVEVDPIEPGGDTDAAELPMIAELEVRFGLAAEAPSGTAELELGTLAAEGSERDGRARPGARRRGHRSGDRRRAGR